MYDFILYHRQEVAQK